MAPKKPKKPSFLQRQRQLRAQQDQVRSASSNKLPPGKKGGDVTKTKPAKPTSTAKPAPVQPVRVRDLGTTKPKPLTGGGTRALPPGRQGGALSRATSPVSSATKNLPKTGGALTGLKGGLLATVLMEGGSRAIDAAVGAYKQAIRTERGQRAAESGQSGRYVPGSQQVRPPAPKPQPKPQATPQSTQPRNFRQEQQASQGQPQRRASGSMPSAVTRSMSGGGTSGSGSRGGSSAAKPAMPGRKWEDFNPGRGTSKSNNPLLDRDKGGFKLRDRMKNREATDQANKAKSMDSNFGQDSGYQAKTKVDGSKYAGKKPDMKKVNEYDRRKRRYYD